MMTWDRLHPEPPEGRAHTAGGARRAGGHGEPRFCCAAGLFSWRVEPIPDMARDSLYAPLLGFACHSWSQRGDTTAMAAELR